MRRFKLTAFSILVTSLVLISCKQEDHLVLHEYGNNNIPMSGDQEVPSVNTTALGNVEANYSQATKTLTYKITWSGLSGNVTIAHIHGIADKGFNASPVQDITSGISKTPAGSYSGSLLIDGVKFTEELLLSIPGKYYFNIHTAANPGGEIRGQLVLYEK